MPLFPEIYEYFTKKYHILYVGHPGPVEICFSGRILVELRRFPILSAQNQCLKLLE